MEQFSHDLTLALEETSRVHSVQASRWGIRRRTRSTGNLPCAPQPTEDSSSSPADGAANCNGADGTVNSILSDSDDRQEIKLSLKSRRSCLFGNYLESDSLNENFSPARPNTRRKRKFKRMAVEYETTPSTPGNASNPTPIFPIAGTVVKKRVLKHTSQENFRANLFFCGKRKRSHRDRYFEQHSSSVPRQRDLFAPKNSYSEYRSRNRSFSSKPCERILPLNKSIVSKIEKISADTRNKIAGFQFLCLQDKDINKPIVDLLNTSASKDPAVLMFKIQPQLTQFPPQTMQFQQQLQTQHQLPNTSNQMKMAYKSGSFESAYPNSRINDKLSELNATTSSAASRKHHKHSKRLHKLREQQLQFENEMDCSGRNDFLSSSSLSSSDSEAAETNDSDREGDDELTDWPGNEAMVNFTSKNDFKRAKPRSSVTKPPTLTQIKSDDMLGQDDDTLMSADELISVQQQQESLNQNNIFPSPPTTLNLSVKYSPASSLANILPITSMPIDIGSIGMCDGRVRNQIESEMSGETSNFLSSPNTNEVREIRAGCRRIRNERPGFTILTSVNEDLSKFLQDAKQERLTLPDTDAKEHEKLLHLAKLYSLKMIVENDCAILTKTSNTTQSVKIDQTSMSKRFLSDYKRRCYGGGGGNGGGSSGGGGEFDDAEEEETGEVTS